MRHVGALGSTRRYPFGGFSQAEKHERVMTTRPHCERALSPSLYGKGKDPQSSPRWSCCPRGASYLQKARAAGLGVERFGPHTPQVALETADVSEQSSFPSQAVWDDRNSTFR